MFSMNNLKIAATMILGGFLLTACGGMTDDLNPSGTNKYQPVTAGTVGNQPGQIAADFSIPTTDGSTFTLSDHLTGGATPADAVVLYFTMWCPTCDSEMDRIQSSLMPIYTNSGKTLRFVAVDYLNTVDVARQEIARFNGFIGVVDVGDVAENFFKGGMGKTVVIDKNGIIRLNEDFRDGENLKTALTAI